MVDNEIIDDLASDISSWCDLYIISSEECNDLAMEFHEKLEIQGISSFVIDEGEDYDFNEGDVLLAVSQEGREDFIRSIVKAALKSRVKVYGICSDFRSPLALLCDEVIVIKQTDDFRQEMLGISSYVCEKISGDAMDDEYEIQDPYLPDLVITNVSSGMNGVIISVNVNVGDEVKEGDVLFVMEAMKMENEFCADRDGIVEEIMVKPGDCVSVNSPIMNIK